MSGRRFRFFAIVCCLSSWMSSADCAMAQSPALTPVAARREVKLAAQPGELDILRQVPSASAFAAVVSEAAEALIIAHAPQPTVSKALPAHFSITDDPDLTVFRLDARGDLGEGKGIRLPRSPKLAMRRHYPLAVAVHPKLPFLYVWQDVVAPEEGAPADEPDSDGFKHLHIYDISSAEPRLVQSAAGGAHFSRGNNAAAIAVDRSGSKLFLPNMQKRVKTLLVPMIGYAQLTPDGQVTDDSDAAHERAAKTSLFNESPCGLGFHDVSETRTIVSGGLGPVTWDERNRRAQVNVITFFPAVGAGYRYRMDVHPTLSTVYLTGLGSSSIYRVEHVDGYFTMFPQRGLIESVLITTHPVVVARHSFVACGSAGFVHLLELDAEGYLNGRRRDIAVPGRKIEALAYSPKYDRLYSTIEEGKK